MPVITVDVGDIIQARIYTYFGARTQLGINVVHYRVLAVAGGGPKLFGADGLAENYASYVDAAYIAILGELSHFLGAEVQVIDPILSASGGDGSLVAAGAKVASNLPAQVSGVISFATDEPTRSGRGRIYIPFPTEADNEATGDPNAAYVGELTAIGAAIFTKTSWTDGVETFTAEQVVWSRTLSTAETVSDVTPKGRWGTQRRRGMYGSLNDVPSWVPLPLP